MAALTQMTHPCLCCCHAINTSDVHLLQRRCPFPVCHPDLCSVWAHPQWPMAEHQGPQPHHYGDSVSDWPDAWGGVGQTRTWSFSADVSGAKESLLSGPLQTSVWLQAQMLMACRGMMLIGGAGKVNGGEYENYLTLINTCWHFK